MLLSNDIVMLTSGGCLYFNYGIWFLFFYSSARPIVICFPTRDQIHAPLQWKLGLLTTGSPGCP